MSEWRARACVCVYSSGTSENIYFWAQTEEIKWLIEWINVEMSKCARAF